MVLSLAISPPSARSLPPSALSTVKDVDLGSCATASLVLVQGGRRGQVPAVSATMAGALVPCLQPGCAREVEARTGKAGVKDNGAAEG